MYKIYQVLQNDTWENIANKFHTSVTQLQEINGSNMLIPGISIIVPKVTSDEYFTTYIVQKGDNLYDIARRYQTSVDTLLSINGLEKNDYLYLSQELLIPRDGISMYVTKDGDTLSGVASNLNSTQTAIIQSNEKIYLLPGQLLVYKK